MTDQVIEGGLGAGLMGVAASRDGRRVYVTATGITADGPAWPPWQPHPPPPPDAGFVWVIDAVDNTLLRSIPVGQDPQAAAVSHDGDRLYVANFAGGNVRVFETTSFQRIASIPLTSSIPELSELCPKDTSGSWAPTGLAYVVPPDGKPRVYVANANCDTVAVIDAERNSLETTVEVGCYPQGVAVTPDGRYVYVTNNGEGAEDDECPPSAYDTGTVSVIETTSNQVTNIIEVGLCPLGVAAEPGGRYVFVVNMNTDPSAPSNCFYQKDYSSVSVIETASPMAIKKTISLGTAMAFGASASDQYLYVANAFARSVSVIDIDRLELVDNLNVGFGPLALGTFLSPPASRSQEPP